MRYLFLLLSLLLLLSPLVYGQQQYSEGACILLQQQIDRFSQNKQNSNFRGATREYERFCRNPTTFEQRIINASGDITEVKLAAEPSAPSQAKLLQRAAETTVSPNSSAVININEVTEQKQSESTEQAPLVVVTEPDKPPAAGGAKLSETPASSLNTVPPSVAPVDYANSAMISAVLIQLLNNIPLIAASLLALLLLVFLLTSWFGLNLPGFKGVFAEYKLNRLLRWRLSRQYQHFRKLQLFTAKGELIIVDHIVLSPFGIFVITVKGERGRIRGSEAQANWTRQYFGLKKQLMNPLHQNYKNVEAVKHLLQLQGDDAAKLVHSVAAFSRLAKFDIAMPANVTFIDAVSAYLQQFTQPYLTQEQQDRFSAQLSQASTAL
jgi:hypothetical protein